ncbi:hypothetical protein TVAG_066650 [Trichomonas vaginalis G3]|uniref:Uncharacterized protein n=1 Tax=Trichomonas vaginalis (strain ATCC PRA-98 / G3) TaxID=412133 RepID=A2DS81_TRIV3|nr:hypothetical protein TVAGG3_0078540 [Trichomonas vaginalis G3]EAY16660.1 hypothetical protein TVAG_066650 [Trichomonas vaginalis G3]KAI5543076.1 hypothetical protein TVAGG3_0078540 [Trichomonas vaginalis G3]|eukprot:XP_001328883.1 hypothetical protein [Trichomonas vaginalis G3]
MIPNVISCKVNLATQTETSVFGDDTPFNFENDENTLFSLEIPKLSYEPEMVQGVIRPLTLAQDGTVINHHIPRLYKRKNAPMIRNLLAQIDADKANKNEYIRQMAAALIPGLNDKTYHSLYTHPVHLPFRTVQGSLTIFQPENKTFPCICIFSLDNSLTIQTDDLNIKCHFDMWEPIDSGKELSIIQNNEPFGKVVVSETVEPVDYENSVPKPILESLHVDSDDQLIDVISENDTSLVDTILCIPGLSKTDASDLLIILHQKKLLSPYVRSKICALQLTNPEDPRDWPELLGRFIFLLDPKWAFSMIPRLRNNDVMSVFRDIKYMEGGALYVLQVALRTLDEVKRSDSIIVFWTLIFMSVLQNATLAKKEHAAKLKKKLLDLWKELQKKKADSNTRKLTQMTIDEIKDMRSFNISRVVNEDSEYIKHIFQEYHDKIFKILSINPYRREESHPLYFPVVIALEEALIMANNRDDFISSDSASLAGDNDVSTYEDEASNTQSNSRSSSRHSTPRNTESSRKSKKVAQEEDDEATMESESYQSKKSYQTASSHSSRRPPPPVNDKPVEDYEEEEEEMIKTPSSKSSNNPLKTPKYQPKQQEKKQVEEEDLYDEEEDYYTYEEVEQPKQQQQQIPPKQQQQQQVEDDDDYYDEEEDYEYTNSVQQSYSSIKISAATPSSRGSQQSPPIIDKSSQLHSALATKSSGNNPKSAAPQKQSSPHSQKPNTVSSKQSPVPQQQPAQQEQSAEYSSEPYSRSSRASARMAAIRAAQRKSQHQNQDFDDDDYSSYQSGGNRNTGTTGYKENNASRNSYTPSNIASSKSKSAASRSNILQDDEAPYSNGQYSDDEI